MKIRCSSRKFWFLYIHWQIVLAVRTAGLEQVVLIVSLLTKRRQNSKHVSSKACGYEKKEQEHY